MTAWLCVLAMNVLPPSAAYQFLLLRIMHVSLDGVFMDEVLIALPFSSLANSSKSLYAPPPFRGSAGPFPLHCLAATRSAGPSMAA